MTLLVAVVTCTRGTAEMAAFFRSFFFASFSSFLRSFFLTSEISGNVIVEDRFLGLPKVNFSLDRWFTRDDLEPSKLLREGSDSSLDSLLDGRAESKLFLERTVSSLDVERVVSELPRGVRSSVVIVVLTISTFSHVRLTALSSQLSEDGSCFSYLDPLETCHQSTCCTGH